MNTLDPAEAIRVPPGREKYVTRRCPSRPGRPSNTEVVPRPLTFLGGAATGCVGARWQDYHQGRLAAQHGALHGGSRGPHAGQSAPMVRTAAAADVCATSCHARLLTPAKAGPVVPVAPLQRAAQEPAGHLCWVQGAAPAGEPLRAAAADAGGRRAEAGARRRHHQPHSADRQARSKRDGACRCDGRLRCCR